MNESNLKSKINSKIIRSGWISKKVAHSFPHGIYRRRFLVLDADCLSYFHNQPDDIGGTNEQVAPEFILPLSEASEVVFLKCNDPTVGYFEVVTAARRYRFRTSVDEAELWVRDINMAKSTPPGGARPLLYMESAKSGIPKTNSTLGGFMKSMTGLLSSPAAVPAEECHFSMDQAQALQRLLDFMSISSDLLCCIIHAVFDSLQQLTKAEKSRASRQLGQVLAMWLGETTDVVRNKRRASIASISRTGHSSQIEMLSQWLQIGLAREFQESCAPSGRSSGADVASPLRREEGCASNTPLRRENVECLFLTSFIKGVAQNTGMLSLWLRPSLIRIASDPESYTIPARRSKTAAADEPPEANERPPCCPDPHMVENTLDMECMNLFELMKAQEAAIPYSMRLLISTIHKLTIGNLGGVGVPEAGNVMDRKLSGRNCVIGDGSSRDERSVFYASSCAVLFLRLICPSVISPLDWGALRMERGAVEPLRLATARSNDDDGLDVSESVLRVEAMNRNPAAASLILVAHILHHDNLSAFWNGDDGALRALQQLAYEVVMVVPIDKLTGLVEKHEAASRSIVDVSTKKAFESAEVRKALVGYAKSIQRIANLSILPETEIRNHAMDTQIRMSIASGNAARVSQYAEAAETSGVSALLSSHESHAVSFQSAAALAVKQLYETFAMLSSSSVRELTEIQLLDHSAYV